MRSNSRAAPQSRLHAGKACGNTARRQSRLARRTRNLELKGYLVRKDDSGDKRSKLIYPTEKAETLKSSKAEIEAGFYEYLLTCLDQTQAEQFVFLLDKLYVASKTESRAGFPHFIAVDEK